MYVYSLFILMTDLTRDVVTSHFIVQEFKVEEIEIS